MVSESVEFTCESDISGIGEVADRLIKTGENYPVWIFNGDLGAGKTTLISSICKKLGVVDNSSSPTFSIVNEYRTQNDNTIYHFDCFRLKSIEEALEIGIEEYLDSDHLCMIEWPEIIEPVLPEKRLVIDIGHLDSELRSYKIKTHE